MIIFFIIISYLKLSYQQQEIIQISSQYSTTNLIEKREIKEDNNFVNNTVTSYCSFFNNRAPSTQINLKNCTWLV
jgi:hypothetical protein